MKKTILMIAIAMQFGNFALAQTPQDPVPTSTDTEIIIEDMIMHRQVEIEQTGTNENPILQAVIRWWTVFWEEKK